jgi:predicted dehydrogenase
MTPTDRPQPLRVGGLGVGGFGLFAMQHFAQVPGVQLTAMGGTHREAALAAARRFGLAQVEHASDLVSRPDVDLVYIATPPFLHHPQARLALQAGKHVICEKPLAVTLEQAAELIELARQKNLLIVANLMQRYNPLVESVRRLIEERLLGEPLHGYFENYAADEGLAPGHWFWDREKSGGIFIEHGVHFFDLLEGWLGPGTVVAAQASHRPGSGFEEQVQCTVRYRDGVLFNFYHGFHQPGRMDRQELRLVFERGDLTLFEWVPTRFRIRALADEDATRGLCELFPHHRLDVTAAYSGAGRQCQGRHKPMDVYQMIELTGDVGREKMHLYGDLLRGMLADQLAWIDDRSHTRKISEVNGRDSLAAAVAATQMAQPAA